MYLVQGLICLSLQSSEPKDRENLFAYIKEAVLQQRTLFFLLASKIEISLSIRQTCGRMLGRSAHIQHGLVMVAELG